MMQGFILLELIVTVLIASFISTGLLTTIVQMSRVKQTINTLTNSNGRVAIAQNQLERDIMGAFVPAQVEMIQTSTLKQEKQKPLEKVFYGTSKGNGGRLELLTFITNNPLEIFYGVKESKLKPRIARVVYRLMPDERRPNSYILLRQEGTSDLTFEKYTPDSIGERRPFIMIDDIQNMTLSYITPEQPPTEQAQTARAKPVRTYKKHSRWSSDPKKKNSPAAAPLSPLKKEPIRLPHSVEVTLSLWNSTFDDTRTFQFTIPVVYAMAENVPAPAKAAAPSASESMSSAPQAAQGR